MQRFHGKRNMWNTGLCEHLVLSFTCKTLQGLLPLKKISVSTKYEELFSLQKFNLCAFIQAFLRLKLQ